MSLLPRSQRVSEARKQPEAGRRQIIMVDLLFYPEDGGNTFLRRISSHPDYTALYLRRWHLLYLLL
jgi:hypothetical protein